MFFSLSGYSQFPNADSQGGSGLSQNGNQGGPKPSSGREIELNHSAVRAIHPARQVAGLRLIITSLCNSTSNKLADS